MYRVFSSFAWLTVAMLTIVAPSLSHGSDYNDGLLQFRPAYTCPSAHSEYKLAYAELLNLKSRLQQLGCEDKPVANQLSSLLKLVVDDRSRFLEIISGNTDRKLSAEDAEFVQQYSEGIALQVANFVSLINELPERTGGIFGSAKSCSLEESDRFAFLGTASSVVYEATRLLSRVAGPQNVPIMIGGHLLSGILKGMSLHMNGRDRFDFRDSKKRLFFAETLCMYQQYDFEVRQLMNPEVHLNFLQKAENDLVNRVQVMMKSCPDCQEYVENLDSETSTSTGSPSSTLNNFGNGFTNPNGTHPITSGEDGLNTEGFSAQSTPVDSIHRESQGFTESEPSRLSFLAQSLSLKDLLLGETKKEDNIAQTFLSQTKSYIKSLVWLQAEKSRFQSIIDFPTRGLEPGEIQSLRVIFRQFMELAGGNFLSWFDSREIPTKLSRFKEELKNANIPMNNEPLDDPISAKGLDMTLPFEFFRLQVINANRDKIVEGPRYHNSLLWLYEHYKSFESRIQSRDEYCEFFSDSLIYSRAIEKHCAGLSSINSAKTYLARATLFLAPFYKRSQVIPALGPVQFYEKHYTDYLGLSSSDVLNIDPTEFMKTLPSEPTVSFAHFTRNDSILFDSPEDQLDFEIQVWKEQNGLGPASSHLPHGAPSY